MVCCRTVEANRSRHLLSEGFVVDPFLLDRMDLMSRSTESSAGPVTKSAGTEAQRPPADFASVSRRVTSRTTDLIAIGIVLIGGLSMGRQLVEWWRAEPPSVTVNASSGASDSLWGSGEAPVELEFGEFSLALRRQTVTGDREAAMAALVEACRSSLESNREVAPLAGEATDHLLARIRSLAPVAESSGKWQVYRLDDRFSVVIGVRIGGEKPLPDEPTKHLACWGLAAPLSESAWTLYLFEPPASRGTAVANAPQIPFPPEGRRLLAIHGADGAGLVGFAGEGLPQDWMTFFDERLHEQGWSAAGGWSSGKGSWSARFVSETPGRTATLSIDFSRDAAGRLMGLIQIVP